MAVGVSDFIGKPIDKTELQVRTASLLKGKEAQDAVKRYQVKLDEQNNLLRIANKQLHVLASIDSRPFLSM
ncbi:MAG: hypothetical protein E4H40_05970 [Candidatus Brocadiia bacterium]|nr:MAG: hypothetical protein E4H40_05970 [Candidatus Brocadiia bacterium]